MILVTGATGKVGGQVAAQLSAAGAPVRALARDPERARAVLPDGVQAVRGDLTDPASLPPALDGVESVFLMWPLFGPEGAEDVVPVLTRHARRVVYLSATGVQDDDAVPPEEGILGFHTVLERLVRAGAEEWTLLRAGGFAANTLEWAEQIRAGDTVRVPYPGAGRSLIHEADIAAVAVRALLTDELLGARPVLTGPRTLTQAEQVHTLGEVLGRTLRVEEVPHAEAVGNLAAMGLPEDVADAILQAHAAMEAEPEPVDGAFPAIMGRPPRGFRDWAADHAGDFR
ncbi:NAD(P)H-binding protein [Streptomyces boncukensis]|uniref:NAD(P)H-binding protein n=1 Tax=Streptomyces boncukensis TaxID=2711219 RepID=A0A6G4WPR7_9ACTN|nr:NAD(P)H-binding protein [Streptomyces boncukensis]NGO67259.1 NAD(P)H-binding protein [Streptomyces boncukensis]